jgi:hypothetical protein
MGAPSQFFGLLGIPLLVETMLLFAAPERLARLAFLPLGSRRIPLTPHAKEQLTRRRVADEGSYRAAPTVVERADGSALATPSEAEVPEGIVRFAPDGARIFAWRRPGWVRKPRPGLQVRVAVEGDELVLRGRYYPTAFLSLCCFVIFALCTIGVAALALFGLLFVVSSLAFDRVVANELFDVVERQIKARLGWLEHAARTRVTSTAPLAREPAPYVADEPADAARPQAARSR